MQLLINTFITVFILPKLDASNMHKFLKSKSVEYYKLLYGKICILISDRSLNLNLQNSDIYYCAIENKEIDNDNLAIVVGNIIKYTKDNQS